MLAAETLAPLATFTTPGLNIADALFTPDGQLLVATHGGLAVWPWRDLFGVQ